MDKRKPTTVGFIPKKKKKTNPKPVNAEPVDKSVVKTETDEGKSEEKTE